MTVSIRQLIMTALENQLKRISVLNGYHTDLGVHVFEWRDTPLNTTEMPGVVYRDQVDIKSMTFGQEEHQLQISLDVSANTTPAGMRLLIADIIKCLGANRTLGGLAEDILPVSDQAIQGERKDLHFFGIVLKFIIQFVTANFDPYTV